MPLEEKEGGGLELTLGGLLLYGRDVNNVSADINGLLTSAIVH